MEATLNVPAVRVVTPVYLFAPVKASVPTPIFVNFPVEEPQLPAIVNMLAMLSILNVVVVADPNMKFLSVDPVAPVYKNVPVPNTKLDAALLAAPMGEFTPPFAS